MLSRKDAKKVVRREFRILIVDDVVEVCTSIEGFLASEGYDAESAHTLDEAWDRLNNSFYHVLILDINLRGDEQPENDDGLQLLRKLDHKGLLSATQVIMYSDRGSLERYREAFGKFHVEDFLEKVRNTPADLVTAIKKIAKEKAQINLSLNTRWPKDLNPLQVVVNLNIAGTRVKDHSSLQEQLATELDDLLCRLFYKSASVLLKPLSSGQSGSAVMLATPFFKKTGAGQAVVVKFGDHSQINQEWQNFKEFVQLYLGGNRSTNVIDLRRSLHLGGIVYSLLGSASDQVESFRSFYARADVRKIKIALQRLFQETCKQWYANRGVLQLLDLTHEYAQQRLGLSTGRLERAISEGLKGVHGKRELYFDALSTKRAFTSPVVDLRTQEYLASTYECSTHGDLNGDNILIDQDAHAWLIDFSLTGPGHILRDFAELDGAIRFQFLKPEEATLEERLVMEDVLAVPQHFSEVNKLPEKLETENAALAKAYETTLYLRKLAQQTVSSNPTDEIREYNVALYYYSLNALRFYSWPQIQRQHALLSASILFDLIN